MKKMDQLQLDNLPRALQSARENRGFSLRAAAELLGIPTSRLRNYENGKYNPTLPELEILSYLYRVPLFILMDSGKLEKHIEIPKADQIKKLLNLRDQIIRTHIQIAVEKAGVSQKVLAQETGIPASRIKRYLNKPIEIPLDDLTRLDRSLDLDPDILFDHESPVGQWQSQQRLFDDFQSLPDEMRDLIKNDDSQKAILAARRLMDLDDQRMHEIAESLEKLVDIKRNQNVEEDG